MSVPWWRVESARSEPIRFSVLPPSPGTPCRDRASYQSPNPRSGHGAPPPPAFVLLAFCRPIALGCHTVHTAFAAASALLSGAATRSLHAAYPSKSNGKSSHGSLPVAPHVGFAQQSAPD